MDPIIEEICRARHPQDIRPASLRRWQDYLRLTVQPQLDQLQTASTKKAAKRETADA